MARGEGCGVIRKGARHRTIERTGPVVLTVNGRLAERLRELARASGAASVESWCEMALETYVVDQRSQKIRPLDPATYTAQQDGEVW